MNPFLLLSISQRDYEIKLGLRISAVGESLQFYFSAKQEHSSRLKQRADFLRILLKNRLEGKRGEIGPNSELVGVINRRWLNELFPRTSGIIIDRRILFLEVEQNASWQQISAERPVTLRTNRILSVE